MFKIFFNWFPLLLLIHKVQRIPVDLNGRTGLTLCHNWPPQLAVTTCSAHYLITAAPAALGSTHTWLPAADAEAKRRLVT